MRTAKLDINNFAQGYEKSIHNSVNTCIRSESIAGCPKIRFPPTMFNTAKLLEKLGILH